jgi:hypothetical protein
MAILTFAHWRFSLLQFPAKKAIVFQIEIPSTSITSSSQISNFLPAKSHRREVTDHRPSSAEIQFDQIIDRAGRRTSGK